MATETATAAIRPDAKRWQLHPAQARAYASKARTIVVVAGRRWGKSLLAAMWTLRGAFADRCANVPGISWFVSPTHAMNRDRWRELLQVAPRGWITGKRGTEGDPDYLELGPARIEFKSAEHPERLVGVGLRRVVIDECGIVREQVWRESILPTLIDHKAPAMLIGTPKGKNWFFHLANRGHDAEDGDVETITGPSMANPFIDAAELERLAAEMPQRLYRQEILAEFLSDEGAVFRGVRACIGPLSSEPTVSIGVDLAKHQDFTVIVGMDAQRRVTFFDRFREISWPLQKQRIMAAAARGGLVLLDSTGVGDPILDDLLNAGVNVEGYKFTNATKQQLVEGLAIAIEKKEIGLPDEPVLLNELEAFEYEVGRTGVVRYNAPEGAHDDCVIALALAHRGLMAYGLYDLNVLNS